MKIIGIVISVFLIFSKSYSQTPTWKNLTSMYNVAGVAAGNGVIWAATSGGVFSYTVATNKFAELTTTEGLSNLQATAIAIEPGNRLIVGEANGSIDEIDSTGVVVRSQRDITNSAQLIKGITGFYITGDSIFASTQFGVVLISSTTFQTLNSYTHFVAAQNPAAHGVAIFKGSIYVANDSGLSVAPRSGINLSAPDLWRVQDTLGLRGGANDIAVFNGVLYAGTKTGLYFSTDGSSFTQMPGVSSAVIGLNAQPGFLLLNERGVIQRLDVNNNLSTFYTGLPNLNDIAAVSDTVIVGATSSGILLVGQNVRNVLPPGPATNIISTLAVDDEGNLWCSTQPDTANIGVAFMEMKYGTNAWINFNKSTYPVLPSVSTYFRVSAVCGGNVFVGTWGNGLVRLHGDAIQQVYNYQNSSLVSSPGSNPGYVLSGDAVCDSHGNLWVSNPLSYNGNPIAVLSSKDSTWYSYNNPYSTTSGFTPLAIDAYGGVWTGDALGDVHGVYHGLFYYDANGTLADQSDDNSFLLTQSNGLLSSRITSISIDNENQVWIGTDLGLDLIYPPDPTTQGSKPVISSIFSMLDQSVNAIDYDALDDKWVATGTGVYELSRDGNTRLASYDITNSPIPVDNVTALACDRGHGIIYLATTYGIISLKTGVVQPNANFSSLKIFPNPAHLPVNQPIQIQGLVANSHLKIFSIDGRLVDEFDAQGGSIAYWYGTDSGGSILPSGVYIIIAYSPDGSQSAVSKIAVIHQ